MEQNILASVIDAYSKSSDCNALTKERDYYQEKISRTIHQFTMISCSRILEMVAYFPPEERKKWRPRSIMIPVVTAANASCLAFSLTLQHKSSLI